MRNVTVQAPPLFPRLTVRSSRPLGGDISGVSAAGLAGTRVALHRGGGIRADPGSPTACSLSAEAG